MSEEKWASEANDTIGREFCLRVPDNTQTHSPVDQDIDGGH